MKGGVEATESLANQSTLASDIGAEPTTEAQCLETVTDAQKTAIILKNNKDLERRAASYSRNIHLGQSVLVAVVLTLIPPQ